MDKILIRGLMARCVIGVFDEERLEKQDVIIDIALSVDLSKAAKTDSFADTVDYKAVKKRVLSEVEQSDYRLIEALAGRIADVCLENPLVTRVKVSVDKPAALRFANSVGVEIERGRT